MSVDQALQELNTAFDAVAHGIKEEYPDLWRRAHDVYQGDDRKTALFFVGKRENLGGEALIEPERGLDKDEAVRCLAILESGGYS